MDTFVNLNFTRQLAEMVEEQCGERDLCDMAVSAWDIDDVVHEAGNLLAAAHEDPAKARRAKIHALFLLASAREGIGNLMAEIEARRQA